MTQSKTHRPATAEEARDIVASAAERTAPLDIVGTGTKRGFGRPSQASERLDLAAISGIIDYEPTELVLTSRPATPLREIAALLAEHRQMLAFEPGDVGTLGGAIATNQSGPRRLTAGAARDHILGFAAINGRAEPYKAGGKVVKNVTGYDLSKLMAGSFGTLSVLTEITVKVLPRPETERSVIVSGLGDRAAIALLAEALNSPHEISGAAHLPGSVRHNPITALRLEGPAPSVAYRVEALRRLVGAGGPVEILGEDESGALWRDIAAALPFETPARRDWHLWRISTAPSAGTAVGALHAEIGAEFFYDWGGGLIWLAVPPEASQDDAGQDDAGQDDAGAGAIRRVLRAHGGHATLVRAPDAIRARVPVFQPLTPAHAALARRVKAAFDPLGIFNPGRMVAEP